MKISFRYLATIIVTAAVTSAIVFVFTRLDDKVSLHEVRVGLKWLHQAQFAGMYVAQEKGFYYDSNLEVTLIERDPKKAPTADQVANGQLDFGIVSARNFLVALNEGKNIVAVGALFQYSPSIIISLKEKKITKPEDLAGKTVGIMGDNEESKLLFKSLLAHSKQTLAPITYSVVGLNSIDALVDGTVDAVSVYRTSDLQSLNKKNIAYNSILPERHGVDLYDDILITSKDFFEENPDVVRAFMNSTRKGWDYVSEYKTEAVDIILKYDNIKYHDKELEQSILNNSLPLIIHSRHRDPIGHMSSSQWKNTYKTFFDQGLIGEFNINNYYIPSYFFDGPSGVQWSPYRN